MNLNYTLQEISDVTQGQIIGPKDWLIKNIVIDTRSPFIDEHTLFIALKGSNVNGQNYVQDFFERGGKVCLVPEQISTDGGYQIVVKNTLKALQDLAKFHRQQFNIPIIGVTGSNGKTVVKEWLYHVLKQKFNICRSPKSYNSQIGVPLSILQLTNAHTLGVFEAGISYPNEMDGLQEIIQPTIGVFTGIGDAHKQNFGNKKALQNEKFKLFKNVKTLIQTSAKDHLNCDIPFSDDASKNNAILVEKTAKLLGLNEEAIQTKMLSLPSISMRLEQMVGKHNNIIINDAYTFSLKSLEIALKHLKSIDANKKKVLFIAPEKGFRFTKKIQELLGSDFVDEVIVFGRNKLNLNKPVHHYKSYQTYRDNPIGFKDSILLFTGSRNRKIEHLIALFLRKKHITKLNIDLAAIRHNLNYFKSKLSPNTQVLAMVKAQSYGGGIVEMAKFLSAQNVAKFGVAYADEGVTLRQNGIDKPILVMNPEVEAFNIMVDHKLEPSIYSLDLLDEFIKTLILKDVKNYPIHIKLDTGMNRLGFLKEDLNDLIAMVNTQPEVYIKSVFSHLAAADDLSEDAFTQQQIEKFKTFSQHIQDGVGYGFIKHISNTAGIVNYPQANFDMVRLGIGLYGLLSQAEYQTENALSFTTQISQIKHIKAGDTVGYGRTYKSEGDRKIATIPVGYADGLRRSLSQGKWTVYLNQKPAKIIGNICMDMCMIDVTNVDCQEGDDVEIFGSKATIFKMAKQLKTIPYEIISAISTRVHRVYVEA